MNRFPPTTSGSNSGNTNTGRFDYSRIQEITQTMKERLKKKFESTTMRPSDKDHVSETYSESSVLDNYISEVERLFLDGVYNGDLRVTGKIIADSIETNVPVVRQEDADTRDTRDNIRETLKESVLWLRQKIKESTIEDSQLIRCRFLHPDFVNEVRFRDNILCEQKVRIGGTQDTHTNNALEVTGKTFINGNMDVSGNFVVDGNTMYVDSLNNCVGIGKSTPEVTLDVSGNFAVDGNTLYVDSSNNRVGIGKTNPMTELDVSGNMVVSGDITTPVLSGQVGYFAISSAPTGWLKCNGATISRTTYANLFNAIVPRSVVTISIASPAVITWNNHGRAIGDIIYFTTTGGLPTGLTATTTAYYIISSGFTNGSFRVSTSINGTAVNTSGTQSGTHTAWNAPFGFGDGSTTFRIPDLRGLFIRGFHDGSTTYETDTTRIFGSYQTDEFESHRHEIKNSNYESNWDTQYTGGNETRPRNIALLACIKY